MSFLKDFGLVILLAALIVGIIVFPVPKKSGLTIGKCYIYHAVEPVDTYLAFQAIKSVEQGVYILYKGNIQLLTFSRINDMLLEDIDCKYVK